MIRKKISKRISIVGLSILIVFLFVSPSCNLDTDNKTKAERDEKTELDGTKTEGTETDGSGDNKEYITVPGKKSVPSNAAMDFVQSFSIGWNLGNALDANNNGVSSETAWGNPTITQDLFDAVAAAGFKTVRIPVTWLGHIGSEPEYTIDSAWLNRVYEVASYANSAGLKAIINIHHDGANSAHWLSIKKAVGAVNTNGTWTSDWQSDAAVAANTAIKAQLAAMWTQIATKFSNTDDWLVFETMNEIHDGGWGWGENRQNPNSKQYDILNEWNQVCVDAIRRTGSKNYIAVPGYVTNPELTMEKMVLPEDELGKLIVSVHFYPTILFWKQPSMNGDSPHKILPTGGRKTT